MPKNKTQKRIQTFKTCKNKTHRAFTKDDYESNNGMMTSICGPAAWHLLHCISFNYPVNPTHEQKKQYMEFILSLKNVLPCGKCRTNLANNFKKMPLTMDKMKSRDTFSKYMYKLHKTVNTMLDKKTDITYQEARDIYEHFRARCMNTPAQTKKIKEMIGNGPGSGPDGGSSRYTRRDDISGSKANGNIEKGCVIPYYGKKRKCVLSIVPQTKKCKTFRIYR